MANTSPPQSEDLFFPPGAPPPYIKQVGQSINNDDTVPEVVVNNPSVNDEPGPETPLLRRLDFSDKQIRQGFIRKVYGIIMTQILITIGVVAWCIFDQRLQSAIYDNILTFLGVTLAVYLTTAFTLICFEGPRRRVPYNYIFLLLFTLSLSALVGVWCSFYDVREVLIACGITFVIVLSLTILAFQDKIDFTFKNGSILCLCLVVLLFSISAAFSPYPGMHQLYCALGVLLMSILLVLDTTLIIGGNHWYEFSPEEYVFAALSVYIDIMNIFIYLLRLMR